MMLPLVVVGCTSKQSVSQCVKPITASGVDNVFPDWQTPLNGIISPSERGWITMQNNWKEPKKYINEQRQIELPISMGNSCNYCGYAASSGV